jgi:hypothetical protein
MKIRVAIGLAVILRVCELEVKIEDSAFLLGDTLDCGRVLIWILYTISKRA